LKKTYQKQALEAIEPFPQGAMVHFAHKLCNGLASAFGEVRLVGSDQFELKKLQRDYQLIEDFQIPRGDMVARTGVLGKLSTAWLRSILTVRFIRQYRRAVNQLIKRQPKYSLVATIFRYPMMGYYLGRMKKNGVKCLQICHEYQLREERTRWKSRLVNWSNRNAYQQFHAIFFLSESQRIGFQKVYPEIEAKRLFVIRHGNASLFGEIKSDRPVAEVAQKYGIDADRQVVLFFGRIRRDKGVEDIIEAMQILKSRLPQNAMPQLVLAGHTRPELLSQLNRIIAQHKLGLDVILFPQYVPTEDVWHLMSSADIAVFPYRSSSQSGALQVAMASGKAIVASDVGGIPEVIADEVTGLLVSPQAPEELAAAIERLLTADELAEKLAKAALRESQTTYGWETVAGQMTTALQTLESDLDLNK